MNATKISDLFKKIVYSVPKKDVEKIILKILIILWVITAAVTFGIRIMKSGDSGIEKKISEAVTKMPMLPSVTQGEIKKYEDILDFSQYPEPVSEYSLKLVRDPFSKYAEVIQAGSPSTAHEWTLMSVGNVPLPIIYKGFIELPDKLIGQIIWKGSTKFVEKGASLNGYRVVSVTMEKISAVDEDGRRWEFLLNKPVLSDKLNAVIYDNVSRKTYTVEAAAIIDDYKVIDIQPDYVILLSNGVEIKLTK